MIGCVWFRRVMTSLTVDNTAGTHAGWWPVRRIVWSHRPSNERGAYRSGGNWRCRTSWLRCQSAHHHANTGCGTRSAARGEAGRSVRRDSAFCAYRQTLRQRIISLGDSPDTQAGLQRLLGHYEPPSWFQMQARVIAYGSTEVEQAFRKVRDAD